MVLSLIWIYILLVLGKLPILFAGVDLHVYCLLLFWQLRESAVTVVFLCFTSFILFFFFFCLAMAATLVYGLSWPCEVNWISQL